MRYVVSVKCNSEHKLANMFALYKYLEIDVIKAKKIANCGPKMYEFKPYLDLSKNNLSTDEIKNGLDEYEIEINIINV